jgi:hypothetical protein
MALGLVFGIYIEQARIDRASVSFYQSETSLYDSFALGKLIENPHVSCGDLRMANVDFADRIYDEAKIIEEYESSNRITESLKTLHRKYDLLRTLLWMNVLSMEKSCGQINTFVYLYEYNTDDVEISSMQTVWSRTLQELKDRQGDNLILIPIAVNQEIVSLDYLVKAYNVTSFPAVLINEKTIFYGVTTADELERHLE